VIDVAIVWVVWKYDQFMCFSLSFEACIGWGRNNPLLCVSSLECIIYRRVYINGRSTMVVRTGCALVLTRGGSFCSYQ